DDITRGVADEQDRDAGLVEDPGAGGVVGGQHRPTLTAFLGPGQVTNGDAPMGDTAVERGTVFRVLGWGAHVDRSFVVSRHHGGCPRTCGRNMACAPSARVP